MTQISPFGPLLLASPAGLGNAEDHDVRHARDGVADGSHGRSGRPRPHRVSIFATSSPTFLIAGWSNAAQHCAAGPIRDGRRSASISAFWPHFPTRHIARKYGAAVARRRAWRCDCATRPPASDCRSQNDPRRSAGMGSRAESSAASIPARARTSRSRLCLRIASRASCRERVTVVDFVARKNSAAIWLTGPASPDAVNKDSRCAERRMALGARANKSDFPWEEDGDGENHRTLRRRIARRRRQRSGPYRPDHGAARQRRRDGVRELSREQQGRLHVAAGGGRAEPAHASPRP